MKAYYRRPEVQESRRYLYYQPERYERMRAYKRAYRGRPEVRERIRRRADWRTRRARNKVVPGIHTAVQIEAQLKRQKYRCYYAACGYAKFEKKDGKYIYHIDHTFPLSRMAGTDVPANDISYIVLACPTCNIKKNDRFPWEWPEGGKLF